MTELWSRIDALRAESAAPSPATIGASRRFRWVVSAIFPLTLTAAAGVAVMLPESLPTAARVSLFGFALATILWSLTSINAAYVAIAVVVLVVLLGGASQEQLFDSLASDVIWLMIGAFILGGALRASGLAGRLTAVALRRPRTVEETFWLVTVVLLPLSVFIPSTSGRAAVVLPLFRTLADLFDDRRITRALALLMPTIILVTTISTIIGAASHLIAVDLLHQLTGETITFAHWALWGVPFGLAAAIASCWVVTRMFLDAELRARPLRPTAHSARSSSTGARGQGPLGRGEKATAAVLLAMVVLWLSEPLHGVEVATVTLVGALVLTMPRVGVISWKRGLASVSWNLVVFVGAALTLGGALIESGAGQWIIDSLFSLGGLSASSPPLVVVLFIALLTLTSHLYLTSHTVRAIALVPPFLYLAASMDLNVVAVLFIATVGMDFCLTLPVSSKAILVFQETDVETFTPSDLMRLSAVLMVVHAVLMVVFYFGFWQWTGLAL
ncbi:anion transporter [Brevibacterium sanguinis]|uniref:Anion transporter n=2 Tax=Brevibacterium TaxID=1696 RepID=A0A366IFV4_9MICO|nr:MULTISPECIES: SLC13 family permease [Brevibacterium]RBP63584.1 anion transporter [Brevibacterium sanguinis]RBP70243.1 anion transporter [Brevibacterium celere]